jgi:hypothetical protein
MPHLDPIIRGCLQTAATIVFAAGLIWAWTHTWLLNCAPQERADLLLGRSYEAAVLGADSMCLGTLVCAKGVEGPRQDPVPGLS